MSVFALPLARILMSLVFIFAGYTKVIGWGPNNSLANMTMWKQTVLGLKIPGTGDPLPNPDLLAQIAAYGLLVGGIMLFLGILSRLTAFGLFVFMIAATVLGHAFWSFADPATAYSHLQDFLKNLAIMGGLLLIVGAGGGAVSIDGMFRRPQ